VPGKRLKGTGHVEADHTAKKKSPNLGHVVALYTSSFFPARKIFVGCNKKFNIKITFRFT
jgi:hypothetical protein